MPEELTQAVEMPSVEMPSVEMPFRTRVRHGVRRPHNWLQLVRFAMVGASGYVVNLVVFAVCYHGLKIDYRLSAVFAFVVSVSNNFLWNRHWTFGARDGQPIFQAMRFFAVSLIAFGFSFVVLVALVSGTGIPTLVAQAIAIVAATPLSFIAQKLWSFRA